MGSAEHQSTRRFTADEAMRMVEVGILADDEHVELLDGALVEMSPQGPIHADAIVNLAERLRAIYPGRARLREDKPLAISAYSLPEPDIAVLRAQTGPFARQHPGGRDTVLVVELAWSSQRIDRRKAAIYAAGGVEVYWLLDLAVRRLELSTTLVDGAHQLTRILDEDDVVALPESDERWLVRDLLP
jgi:Uma2 family endonuclease